MSPADKTKKAPATKASGAKGAFSADERAAMRERAREMKAEARGAADRAQGEADLLSKIAAMKGSDRTIAKRVHELVSSSAPALMPKTWYGMPAYANAEGKVVCFFQSAGKFKSRYATLGFSDSANLDAGDMWPTTYALKGLNDAEEKKIIALVKKAVS